MSPPPPPGASRGRGTKQFFFCILKLCTFPFLVYDENEAVELNGNGEAGNRRAGNAALKTRGSVESEVGPENAYRKVLVSDMRAILKDRPGHKGNNGEKLFKVYKIFLKN